jgi:hypothetical protein
LGAEDLQPLLHVLLGDERGAVTQLSDKCRRAAVHSLVRGVGALPLGWTRWRRREEVGSWLGRGEEAEVDLHMLWKASVSSQHRLYRTEVDTYSLGSALRSKTPDLRFLGAGGIEGMAAVSS